eukprot:755091-Hanusia_phi.AAC.5
MANDASESAVSQRSAHHLVASEERPERSSWREEMLAESWSTRTSSCFSCVLLMSCTPTCCVVDTTSPKNSTHRATSLALSWAGGWVSPVKTWSAWRMETCEGCWAW